MSKLRSVHVSAAAAAAALLVASMGPSPALAGHGDQCDPRILPPQSHPYGHTYGEWSGAWWRWAYSIPVPENPVLDRTGGHAAVDQSGPVWFLAGTFGGPAERTVVVPQGKALFFPIFNSVWVNFDYDFIFPACRDNPWSPEQEALARAVCASQMDNPPPLACEIDGHPVAHITGYRCQTPPGGAYMVTLPENDVWDLWLVPGCADNVPAGTYGPSVDDGYYLMLAPLRVGTHTIHFSAGDLLDVTYHLTVACPPPVLPPHSHPFGRTYGEWGAAWQQWVFRTTTENCPVTDTTGERALVGQSGHVYFLAGTFGELPDTPWAAPNPVTRTVMIPEGKPLCIPINNWDLCYPEDLPGVPPKDAVATMYEWLNAFYDDMPEANLECEVDGASVENLRHYRAQSEPFQIYAPAVNVENDLMDYWTQTHPCYPDDPQPWYRYYARGWHLSVSDGYYVMLSPLPRGTHTIHIRTGPADSPFCDVYYILTVQHH